MNAFTLTKLPTIMSGQGTLQTLPDSLKMAGCDGLVMLILDPGIKAAGLTGPVETMLKDAGFEVLEVTLPPGEPKEAFVRQTVAAARQHKPAGVVCMGGGSTMDAGKLITCLIEESDDVAAYRLAAQPVPQRRRPLVCIPTTSGTGSEVTAISVISDEDNIKYWFAAPAIKPDLVILDPELVVGLPAEITASTGMDAFVHAVEAATNVNANPTNSMYSYRAIKLISDNLETAVREPGNLEARSAMQEAAAFGGAAIGNTGVSVAHAVGHALGSLANVPHGRAVAIGLCRSADISLEGHEDVFTPVAQAMGVKDVRQVPDEINALAGRAGVDLGLSHLASEFGPEKLAAQMQNPENVNMVKSNRRPLGEEELLTIAARVLA